MTRLTSDEFSSSIALFNQGVLSKETFMTEILIACEQIKLYEYGNNELRISIDASRTRIAELELRLSLSDSALDEYKQQVTELEVDNKELSKDFTHSKYVDRYTKLESPRTCETCKHRSDYEGEFTCKHLDSIINTSPQEPYGVYIQDADTLSCINYEPKKGTE